MVSLTSAFLFYDTGHTAADQFCRDIDQILKGQFFPVRYPLPVQQGGICSIKGKYHIFGVFIKAESSAIRFFSVIHDLFVDSFPHHLIAAVAHQFLVEQRHVRGLLKEHADQLPDILHVAVRNLSADKMIGDFVLQLREQIFQAVIMQI